jgi:hypothetical protein
MKGSASLATARCRDSLRRTNGLKLLSASQSGAAVFHQANELSSIGKVISERKAYLFTCVCTNENDIPIWKLLF